jgi:hypothetical protein
MQKLAYIKLNIQMPCPPRGTVPVNSGRTCEVFHSVPSDSNFGNECDRSSYAGNSLSQKSLLRSSAELAWRNPDRNYLKFFRIERESGVRSKAGLV